MAQTAEVTIITKWGSRAPTTGDIVKGELAVDLVNKVLYTNDGNQIIEVGGGEVKWDQITGVPDEITNIIDGVIDLDALVELAGDNAALIVQLNADLTELAARVTQNEKDIAGNKSDISDNSNAIDDLDTRVGDNESNIADNAAEIGDNTIAIGTLDGRVTKNETDIKALQAIVDGDLTGLVLGGTYKLPANQVSDVTAAATTAGINTGDTLDQHAKETNKGMYFVVEGEGTLGGLFRESSNGEFAQNGDWLVCDGVHGWILMSFGGDHVTWGSIGGDIANQDDLQAVLDTKLQTGDTLDGGHY